MAHHSTMLANFSRHFIFFRIQNSGKPMNYLSFSVKKLKCKFIVKFIVVSCQTSIKFNISRNATHWRASIIQSQKVDVKLEICGKSTFKLTVHFHLEYLHFMSQECEKNIVGTFRFAIYRQCDIWASLKAQNVFTSEIWWATMHCVIWNWYAILF